MLSSLRGTGRLLALLGLLLIPLHAVQAQTLDDPTGGLPDDPTAVEPVFFEPPDFQAVDEAFQAFMFDPEAQALCDAYFADDPPLEPEGIDAALLRFLSLGVAEYYGEEVDLASDPELVARMRSFIVTGLDCVTGQYVFDLSDQFSFDDAALESLPLPDDEYFAALEERFYPPLESDDLPEMGDPPPDDPDAEMGTEPVLDLRTMASGDGGSGGSGGGFNNCCVPMGMAEPNGGHPFTVECPPSTLPLTPAPYGNVVPDLTRCPDGGDYPVWANECAGARPSQAQLVGLAYACQMGNVARAKAAVDFHEHWRDVGKVIYMAKPMAVAGVSAGMFVVTAPTTVGGVAVAGAIAVCTSGAEGAIAGNTAGAIMEGGSVWDPRGFVAPAFEAALDYATPGVQEMAQDMIGSNAELAEMARGDLMLQRRKLKELKQQMQAMGGTLPPLTDTACNNMDAWFWK